jgi:hypothetical protein
MFSETVILWVTSRAITYKRANGLSLEIIINYPTPRNIVLLDKLVVPYQIKKFSVFYRTGEFVAILTSTAHLSLFWARLIQYMPPNPTS